MPKVGLTCKGFDNDRLLMVVNRKKLPITQRMIPELATVSVKLFKETGILVLEPPKQLKNTLESFDVYMNEVDGEELEVDLHGLKTVCVDCGDAAAEWIDKLLSGLTRKKKNGFRLVRIKDGHFRGSYGTPGRYFDYR